MIKILYVEDDELAREIMKKKVEKVLPVEVVAEKDGTKALGRIEEVSAVILDTLLFDELGLPQKYSGPEVARRIHSQKPELPIFVVGDPIRYPVPVKGYFPKAEIFLDDEKFAKFIEALKKSLRL